ncbi:hypothetical protein HK103_007095 [Boothiomyces macroporosus]|uniref:Nitric oxide synthase-interacting protein zinc-finger domain-containing protein n=1 Tax=Boothiomyces macroporosus TaxID=261099 RepID=A0AAD5Y475_9FUNG|nr:hypothetical protein HK103_007095 [Boothiomyces macroporosus]
MTRHSKNNTALGFFTNAERSKLTYGTQSQRLGRDSMRPIDSCVLCLQTARNPVCCVKGHLYCKECVVENIITQKKEIEREEKAVLIHNQTVETEEERKARLEHERKVQEFISQETQVKSTLETGKKERELKSFWIPQLQPEANPELAKVSKSTPQCVAGKAAHNLSLKKLITVKFTEKGEGDEMQKICPVCVKSVKLGMEMSGNQALK